MRTHIDFMKAAPKVVQSLLGIEAHLRESGLSKTVLSLIKVRGSQINGCAYCIDMHTKDALAEGETTQRLFGLNAWREAPYYTDKERAALEWTEAVTLITEGHVSDEVYESVRQQFSEAEIVNLTIAAMQINAWNRLVISMRVPAGTYQVGQYRT